MSFQKSLLGVLKGLIGADVGNAGGDAPFLQSADSDGVNFYLERSAFAALRSGGGTAAQKIQLIVLNMLEEQGFAERSVNGFHVASEDVAGMDDEQAEVLQLPSRFPGSFTTHISGRSGNAGFAVRLAAQMDGAELPFEVRGPYLYLTSRECYRLTPAELMGVSAWQTHSALPAQDRGEGANLRMIAELQTAARSGMRVDLRHFDRLDVIDPESVGVTMTRMPDGSMLLCPSLGDGSTPDQLEKRWSQIEKSANGGVMRVDNRVVLLDDRKMAAIREILGNKRIPADKVAEFIATPSAFLDAALVNLDLGFSVRVAGIGKLQHMEFGEVDAAKPDWFVYDARPEPAQILPNVIKSEEDLAAFEQSLRAAREQGADTLVFDGKVIDISQPVVVDEQLADVRQVIARASERGPDFESEPSETPKIEDEPQEQVAVLLHDAEVIHEDLSAKAKQAKPRWTPAWDSLARQPFPHQREGVEWMLGLLQAALDDEPSDLYRLQGGLLADDMGLGKTYMSLVVAGEYLAMQKEAGRPQKPILVIAPLSLLENWNDEVGKTFNSIPFRDVVVLQSDRDLNRFRPRGAGRESLQRSSAMDDAGEMSEGAIRYSLTVGPEQGVHRLDMDRRVVLATYQTLRDYQFSLCRIDWGLVIFDEAQNVKNPNTLQSRAAKGLKADFKLLATGTPVENSLGDFWCLMDTAQPGLLGGWATFRDRWIRPIAAASDDERNRVRSCVGEELRNTVGRFMLRRVKEDQLRGLPTKTLYSGVEAGAVGTHVFLRELAGPMRGEQLKRYDDAIDEYRASRGSESSGGAALAVLQKLRSICLHPCLDESKAQRIPDASGARAMMCQSGKLASLLPLLDGIQSKGEKVILFMMTKKLQRLVKLCVDQIYGLNVAIINGETNAVAKRSDDVTRKSLIADFEARQGFNILIMSPVAAGVGLTVVGANHVVHVERHWNPAKEAQASDRVYRIGQTKDVHIYMPAAIHPQFDSFDVHLDRLLRSKLMLKDAVVTPESVENAELIRSLGL